MIARAFHSRPPLFTLALGVAAFVGTLVLGEGEAEAIPAYIRSDLGGPPWGSITNEQAKRLEFDRSWVPAVDHAMHTLWDLQSSPSYR